MILQASKRGGGTELGRHLTNQRDNEHVEVHEVRGFMSETVMGAMKEVQAMSLGTKCRQYLFSLSLSPPQAESVRAEVFETAIDQIEERLGLTGQPRMVVFHEKEGRRHAHCVWSRIDANTMTARDLPFFKMKLRDVSKQLYLENGWQMPRGFVDSKLRDPRNFSLAEYQQASRAGLDAKAVKATVQECWAVSADSQAFGKELETRGLFLAKGDRRGHVIMTHEGEVFALSRMVDKKAKEVVAKLGEPDSLRSVDETRQHIVQTMTPRLQSHIREAKRIAANQMKPLLEKRQDLQTRHAQEREKLDEGQRRRHQTETRERAMRIAKGFRGLWDRISGEHAKIKKQNEVEAFFGLQRDRDQRHALIEAQMVERRTLQADIVEARHRHARQVLLLYKDAAQYRDMQRVESEPSREFNRAASNHTERADRGRDPAPRPKGRGLELG
ncbi:relaxase/mobilization nuclease domain-containing protein [Caulobacter soli]|uniref:relaxase/mobilization nuclease domain-containing protein n=1 Tax=Caulobacter soli TaxID=2708539 RepID=UPI0013EA196A|nr:relaxase [Caulobacter soli]